MDEEKQHNGSDSLRYKSGGTSLVVGGKFLAAVFAGVVYVAIQLSTLYQEYREATAENGNGVTNQDLLHSVETIRHEANSLGGKLSSVQSRAGYIEAETRNLARDIRNNATQINRLKQEHGAGEP